MLPSPPGLAVSNPPIDDAERLSALRRTSELLRLASNPDRLKILLLLACEDLTVSDLIGEFPDHSDQYISRHLGHLRRGGLVEDRVAGQFRIYALTETGKTLLRTIGKASGW